jgi:hypothetical protein
MFMAAETEIHLEIRSMSNKLEFTADELAQMHLLLSQDLESSRVELHHTAGLAYRDYVKLRIERGQALLTKMDAAFPVLRIPQAV